MDKVNKYYSRVNSDIIKTDAYDIILHGNQDIYVEGDQLDILNLTEDRHISFNKILRSNNSLRAIEKNHRVILSIYTNTDKKRVLRKVGTDNQNRPVLKFNDCWIRLPDDVFRVLNLNYLHSLNKEYFNLLENLDLDKYRVVLHRTRYSYPDLIIYKKGQDNYVRDKKNTNKQ